MHNAARLKAFEKYHRRETGVDAPTPARAPARQPAADDDVDDLTAEAWLTAPPVRAAVEQYIFDMSKPS